MTWDHEGFRRGSTRYSELSDCSVPRRPRSPGSAPRPWWHSGGSKARPDLQNSLASRWALPRLLAALGILQHVDV